MPQQLPQPEIQRLRWLARRQKEIADLPVMEKRRRRWAAVKEAAPGARPVFTLEHWTFNRDFMPASLLECQTPLGRQLEQRMLEHIRHHEIIDDDLPCPGHLDAGWHLRYDEFGGLRIPVTRARDAEGVETAYHYDCPIKDLAIDPIDFLDHPPAWSVDREATADEIRFLEELLGDLLPVRLVGWAPGAHNLTGRVIRLMDQAAFFVAMHEAPEKLRRVMRYLTDSAVQYDRWAEREGLLGVTNGGLPPAGARLGDMWVYMESQETVGVSPAFFAEFCFPYYREIAELFGHVYWGCCEPADPLWDVLRHMPNLRAVSISKWADQEKMARFLEGKGIVFSRKPDPNLLGVDVRLDEAKWKDEIDRTLAAVTPRGVPLEIVVRDVYTLHGDLAKASRATALAREAIARFHGPDAD